ATETRAVEGADLIVFAVKPQQMRDAASALSAHLDGSVPAILTIAAGIRLADLARWIKAPARLIRAMPNTPALIGQGISGVYAGPAVDRSARELAGAVLEAAG